jgi:hypothetical protein
MYTHNLKVSETRANARAGVHVSCIKETGGFFILKDVFHFHRLKWAEHVGRRRMRTGEYRGLVGKPVGKRPLEKLGRD